MVGHLTDLVPIVVVSLRNLPRLPVCGCLLVPRPPIYISGIHNVTFDFHLHRARVMKVCVFLRRTPPSFLENHNTHKVKRLNSVLNEASGPDRASGYLRFLKHKVATAYFYSTSWMGC